MGYLSEPRSLCHQPRVLYFPHLRDLPSPAPRFPSCTAGFPPRRPDRHNRGLADMSAAALSDQIDPADDDRVVASYALLAAVGELNLRKLGFDCHSMVR